MSSTTIAETLRKSSVLPALCLSVFLVSALFVSGAKAQEEDIRERISEVKQEIETMESDNEQLRTEISDREAKIEELKQKIERLDKQLQEIQESR